MKKRLLAVLLTLCMVISITVLPMFAAGEYEGKTVIIHTNDVHGAIEEYAKIAALKADYEAAGAKVLLVDAGDYSQGTTYVSTTKGADAVTMMNAVGYNYITIGNHEFDYGYAQLRENLAAFKGTVLCADVLDETGKTIFDGSAMTEIGGVKIGFVGLETPESQTKANPALIKGLRFLAAEEMHKAAQAEVDKLRTAGADVVVILSHLGVDSSSTPNTSYELYAALKNVDFVIDGHSHTVMTEYGEEKLPIQSTGSSLANAGIIVIDNATKKIEKNELVDLKAYEKSDETVAAAAKVIVDRVNAEYNVKFAESKVDLNGDKQPGNRTEETNLGDLITDAMVWKIKQTSDSLTVPETNIVAITNGGGIRAWIRTGDITKKDVNTVLPFGNTLAVVYVTGDQLLEALEASTFCTPESLGGFPQVAGMKFSVNTAVEYDKEDQTYPGSTYYGPKSIKRVTITEINGKPFDKNAKYAVITNNFVAAGGDTYYAFASANEQFDTGLVLDEVVMEYITAQLNGVVDETYAKPQGRITVCDNPPTGDFNVTVNLYALVAAAALAMTVVCVAKKKQNG